MNATHHPWSPSADDGPPHTFRVTVTPCSGRCLVTPHGELDLATVMELRAVLARQSRGVILDLRELSFIDVTGLRLLLEADSAARRDGTTLGLVVGDPPPLVFEMADVGGRFTYVESPRA